MKKIFLYIIILISVEHLQAQDARISGTVSSDGQLLELATVQVEGPSGVFGALTNAKGKYEISELNPGKYTLKISHIGYKTFSEEIALTAHQSLIKHIHLKKNLLNLDQIVVSGTRYGRERSESPVIVNVVSPKLFNAIQSMALSEGISYQPGVRVETNCQNCGFTQVRLNGLEGAYSQILINSRPVFSALNSVYGLDQIPSNMIDRVEVVRSGGSALYGSNAIAGTINIITKDPIMNNWQVNSNFAAIDGNTPDHTVSFNGSLISDDLNSGVTFYGMYRNRDSYDANTDGFTELVKLENNTLGAKAFLRPGKRSKITLDFSAIQEYRRGGDRLNLAPHFTDITEELDHNTLFSGITFDQHSKDNRSKFSAYISAQTTQRDSYYGGLGGGKTAEDSLLAINAYGNTSDLAIVSGFQFFRDLASGDVLTLGIENQFSDVTDEMPGYNRLIDQRVNNLGFYGQYEWKPGERFTALAGMRFDQATVDGIYDIGTISRETNVTTRVFSPRLTVMYGLVEGIQLRGGYARGFRAPQAFNEDLHISSVGGEPQFVIISDELEKELSDAFTASIEMTQFLGKTETRFLIEGFYTLLQNPFTVVSTGSTLANGSILEEVRNGTGASVGGTNIEISVAPSPEFMFQAGGTWQQSAYEEDQILFEPEDANNEEPVVSTDEFVRNPNLYGYFTANWTPDQPFTIDLTGAYTGSMIVPRVVSETGFLDFVDSNPFLDMNFKLSYHLDVREEFHLELSSGIQNIFNSFQDDFDTGPTRDSDYIYGPAKPRTFFFGVKIGDFH